VGPRQQPECGDSRIREDHRLLKAIDDDALGRRLDMHAALVTVRQEDIADGPAGLAVFERLDADLDTTKEGTSRPGDPEQEDDERGADRDIDAVFDGREDTDNDGRKEDDGLERCRPESQSQRRAWVDS
jgi:hypothetical protein